MARLSALFGLIRWPGAVTAGANAATGFLLAHRPDSPGGRTAALGAVAGGMLIYAGGVVLNDVADAEKDRTAHPARPIPSGEVSVGAATRFGGLLLAAGVAAFAGLANLEAGGVALAAAAFAVLYDFVARRVRLAGCVLLGLARAFNGAAGAVAAVGGLATFVDAARFPALFSLYPGALLAYTALLVWVSTFEDDGARPRWLPGFCAIALAVAAAAPWMLFARTTWPTSPAVPLLVLAGALVAGARDAMDVPGPGMGAVVRAGVFGFLLVDATWLFGSGRYEAGFWMILVYVVLRLALMRARS
jgi:4-hydroxybenzoate polyprenyltransferase